MAQTFDTLAAAKRLHDAGMGREQAEAVAAAIREGQGELVTKADLAALEARLKADLWRAAFGIIVANAAITFGLLKLILP